MINLAFFNSCIQGWYLFLKKHLGVVAFTINQHYLSHISFIVRNLGPLRQISARPLERSIGLINKRIKSPSKPGENAANKVLNHHRSSESTWQSYTEKSTSIRSLHTTFEVMNNMLPEVTDGLEEILKAHYLLSNTRIEVNSASTVKIINEFITRSTQSIKLSRGESRPSWVIVEDCESTYTRNGIKFKLCFLKKMFIWNDTSFGLVQVARNLLFDVSKNIHYFNRYERDIRWELISLNCILNYAILIDSLIDGNRTYITWKI